MIDGVALRLERLEGIDHVVGGERTSVGEPRLGAEIKGHRHLVVSHLGALRDESIDCVGLVGRWRHQRVEQELQALRRIALENVVVKAVEGGNAAPADQREGAALGRVWVSIVEMVEIGGIGQIAES
jgi:hypothetical protein